MTPPPRFIPASEYLARMRAAEAPKHRRPRGDWRLLALGLLFLAAAVVFAVVT